MDETQMKFGDLFRKLRIEKGYTLRAFCERFGYDPGNISKLENSSLLPTLDDDKLRGYALALGVEEGSENWVMLFDLAHMAKHSIPRDLNDDFETSQLLPAFFRTMRNKKLDKDKFKKLIDVLKS